MSCKNATLSVGVTATATGGTSKQFSVDSVRINNGCHIIDTTASDLRVARGVNIVSIPAVYDAKTGEFTKFRRTTKMVQPFILASGKIVHRSVMIEVEDHPEVPIADQTALRHDGVQTAVDADFAALWAVGSVE